MKAHVLLTAAVAVLAWGCTKNENPVEPNPDPDPNPVVVTTATLPAGVETHSYGPASLTATGGDGSYAWTVVAGSGDLPGGLALSSAGAISGSPTSVGGHAFTVRATSGGVSAERALSIDVIPLLTITTTSLPDGQLGAPYPSQSLEATGGIGNYVWTLASGSGPLPDGLTLSADGDIGGTPTSGGAAPFTVEVTSGTQTAEQALSITIDVPTPTSRIVFTRDMALEGNQIFSMNPDGSDETQLTSYNVGGGNKIRPAQSADGTRIAYTATASGTHIWVMEADGSNPVNLTPGVGNQMSPEWSPDGTKLLYQTDEHGSYNTEIYVIDADGSNPQRLTDDPAFDGHPEWSPDGTRIAFMTNRDGNYEIYVMDVDGSNAVNITNNAAPDLNPSWSPDGTQIAFTSNRGGGTHDIYVVDVDGSNVVNVTNSVIAEYQPTWSPDGTQLAFISFDDGPGDIFVIDLDGANRTNLTNHAERDDSPAWAR